MKLTFKKLANKWYCDLPEYPGYVEDLEMVAGADKICEILPYKDHPDIKEIEVFYTLDYDTVLQTKEQFKEGYINLKFMSTGYPEYGTESGATYLVKGWTKNGKINSIVWLCDVTKYVFEEEFPQEIIFKPIE